MFLRMLVVWLIVMNLAVAAWWWLHRAPQAVGVPLVAAGVPSLELVAEEAASPTTTVAPATPPAPTVAVAPAPAPAPEAEPIKPEEKPAGPVCASFGPFNSEALARAAMAQLPSTANASLRTAGAGPVRGYNVYMPPLASREEANAMAERLRAAGFKDLMVQGGAENTNGIALGRFGSEANAQTHQQALRAKGFSAQIAPIGGGDTPRVFVDVRAPAGFDAAATRGRIGAAGVSTRACPAG